MFVHLDFYCNFVSVCGCVGGCVKGVSQFYGCVKGVLVIKYRQLI